MPRIQVGKLLQSYSLSENDYSRLKDFFKGRVLYLELQPKQRNILKTFDEEETTLSVGDLTKVNDLKTRLVKDEILTAAKITEIENSELFAQQIAAQQNFRFSDVKRADPWTKRIDAMFLEAKKSFSQDLLSLSEAEQKTMFEQAVLEEFQTGNSALAREYRTDKGLREPSSPISISKKAKDLLIKGRAGIDALFAGKPVSEDTRTLLNRLINPHEMHDEIHAEIAHGLAEYMSDVYNSTLGRLEVAWRGLVLSEEMGKLKKTPRKTNF